MIRSDEHCRSITDAFHAAAIDGKGWYAALDGLAKATGSRSGQLIGIGADAAVPFNIMTELDPALVQAFADTVGYHPQVNPRVRAGMESPILTVMAESDFITADEHRRHPHYRELRSFDVPFICLTTLERHNGVLIGLAVNRSHRQGHITAEQRETFAAIAPHVRAAVRTSIALEGKGSAVLAGAMEALSLPAFVCDRTGRVAALTPAAEALVSSARGLELRRDRLHTSRPEDARALTDAIDAVTADRARPSLPRTVIVRGKKSGAAPVVLDVIPLPARELEFNLSPRVLIVARGAGAQQRKAAILQAAYALTSAETDVALQLAAGQTADAIAASRGVAVGTVRLQIKSILAKVGVRRQVELVSRLGEL